MNNSLNQYSPMQTALALLQPTISVSQKRADAQQNLMLQAGLTQMAQQDTEAARQQALLLQQRQAQLMAVPFLEKDQQRWKLEMDKVKAKIRNRFENEFGGDEEAYARSLLEQDSQGLSLDAQRSPLYASSLERRANFLQAQKDAQDGKIHRSVTYQLANGQSKTAPFEQAYLDFNNGETQELPYQGAFKVDGKWRKHFDDVYSPRVDKLGKFRPDQATPQEIATSLVATEGLTSQDAMDYLHRVGSMLSPVYYKFDARDPYREEQLAQGRQNLRLRADSNNIAREKNKIDKQGQGQIDMWDATFNNADNVITRTKDGQPGTVNVSLYDPNMQAAGSGKLQGFTGKVLGKSLLEATGAVYDKESGTHTGAGGQAYVAIKNQAGGVDLRSTDLSGIHYTTKPGNIYRYETPPTEYERSTGRKPYKYLQEQVITLTSDEAKRAKSGKLFDASVPWASTNQGGLLGNTDTPTGKGAYTTVTGPEGQTLYQFRILQPVVPTMLDRMQPTLDRMNTQTQTGQAAMHDAQDDLNYY